MYAWNRKHGESVLNDSDQHLSVRSDKGKMIFHFVFSKTSNNIFILKFHNFSKVVKIVVFKKVIYQSLHNSFTLCWSNQELNAAP